jgi:PAS domain S-box-containing protein
MSLRDLSWQELVDRLHKLQQRPDSSPTERDAQTLAHELRVHQVELEMQNRELREAQQRLEFSRARYADLYDRAPVGYATLDPHGTILEINLTGAALMGRERDRLVGVPFAIVARVHDKSLFYAHLDWAKHRGAATGDIDVVIASAGNRILQLTSKPIMGTKNELTGFRTTMIDVTELRLAEADRALLAVERRARAEADSANQMKDQFLGIVSHELRTPLNAIVGWTNILWARTADAELVARGLSVLQRNGQALARIVGDILDVSRIVNGKLDILQKKMDLVGVVQGAIDDAKAPAQTKHITMTQNLVQHCRVMGDEMRLQQVVYNLLSNALKFTPEGGHIDVTLEGEEERARLVVRDDGCGIDESDLPCVFEHFRQADSSTTRVHGGLGLGLAIARHIVQAHGGTIEAKSEGRGHGATLTVLLPRRPMSSTSPPPPSVPSRRSIAGVRVLYVDDEVDALELMDLTLSSLGAIVRTARSVDVAIHTLSRFIPDVIVSDIAMPGRDGYDFVRQVRNMPVPLSDVPAIALSAYARADDAERALRAGFTRHLAKPLELEKMAEAIAGLVPSS